MNNLLKTALLTFSLVLSLTFAIAANAKMIKVKVSHGSFSPSSASIKVGDKVTFTNIVEMKHTVVISGMGSSSKLKKRGILGKDFF